MNINTLIDSVSQAIATNSAVDAWCQTTYGKGHIVYVNIDERNLPGQSACPYVAVWPGSKRVGQHVSTKQHSIECVCCIYDEVNRTHSGIDNIIEYIGVSRIEEFRKVVETAIAGMSIGNRAIAEIDIDFETISQFPFIFAGMVIDIPETVTLGSDYLS